MTDLGHRKEPRNIRSRTVHAKGAGAMKAWTRRMLSSGAPAATILVRGLVGMVFLSEGIQKFLFPGELGAGRFARIGIPAPGVMGPFVGVVEIVAGFLVLLGLLTRLAAIVLFIDISVAILSTKIPILLGHGFWLFALPKLQRYGFWSMAHEARVDFCMWMGCLFLAVVGSGVMSMDGWIEARSRGSGGSSIEAARGPSPDL